MVVVPRPPSPRARIRRLAGLALAGLALVGAAPPAHAHEGVPIPASGGWKPEITRAPTGVNATAFAGPVPAITLTATLRVTVLGRQGEPMARLRGDVVEVNDASPTWKLTAQSRGERPTGRVSSKAPPRWRKLDDRQLTWLEPRAQRGIDRTEVRRWTIPLEIAGASAELRGKTSWFVPGPPDSPWLRAMRWRGTPFAALALLILVIGAAVVARRPNQGSTPG